MGKLFIKIWDVQHGSAAYIRTPNGKHIVIDLGTGDISGNNTASGRNEEFSPLTYIRTNWRYNVNRLDLVIITHPHRDHIDDIDEFDNLNPRVLIRPNYLTEDEIRGGNQAKDKGKIDKYLAISGKYNSPIGSNEDPTEAANTDGVEIKTFTSPSPARSNLNNHSIVTFVTYGELSICIPGDNESASWKEMLAKPGFKDLLQSTKVLVASHHGRESGYYEELFDYCKPFITIVSDGPQGDTCVASKYGAKSIGWEVYSFSRQTWKERHCLTTRSDGSIHIERCFDPVQGENTLFIAVE